jgi:hypothetical protein
VRVRFPFSRCLQLALLLALSACITSEDIRSIREFRTQLADTFAIREPAIEFRNNRELVLILADTPFARMSAADRSQQALLIARFAVRRFPRPERLATIRIGFGLVDSTANGISRSIYQTVSVVTDQANHN